MTDERSVRKPINIQQAEYSRNVWSIKPESTVTVEDMLKPDFWAHISKTMRSGDRIEVIPEDKRYFAEFFVMACSTNWAKVILLRSHELIKDADKQEVPGFIVKFAGPHDKWRVQNGDEVISKGHDDKESATQWLAEHLKTIR